MGVIAVDRQQTRNAVEDFSQRLADVLRAAKDTSAKLPGADWTAGEAAAHLATAGAMFVEWAGGTYRPYGQPSRQGLAVANANRLAEFTERDGAVLADRILDTTQAFLAAADANPQARRLRTPLVELDAGTLMSYMLTHMVGHGTMIAKALRAPLPVSRETIPLTLPFLTSVMPAVLKQDKVKGLTACFLIHLRKGPQVAVTFDSGAMTVGTKPPRRVDVHISAEPIAFFQVALGNISQWGPIATGKLLTWGTRPWLALQFVGYFDAP